MKRAGIIAVIAALALIPSLPVIASDITTATYHGTIVITNNSTTITNGFVSFSLPTQTLIDNGFLSANCTNSAIRSGTGGDTGYQFGVGDNNTWVFLLSIPGSSQINYHLYTGGTVTMNGKLAYFPGATGMTTTDNDTYLEPGDNFSILQKVWVNTTPGSNKCLVSKPGTLLVYITGTENITASLTNTQTIDIGSAATDRGASRSPGYTHIDLTNSANATGIISSVSIWANTEMTGVRVGTFYLDSGTIYKCRDSETIGTVAAGSALTYSGLSIDVVAGDFIGYYCDGGDIETDSAGGSGIRWIIGEYIDPGDSADYALYANQRISLYGAGYLSITASGVASGNHTITTALSGGTFSLTVDSSAPVTTAYEGSTANTDDDWTFYTNNVTAYMEYQKIYIGGVLRQYITWQNAATFTDLSGFEQNATPTFRTTGTTGLSATLTNYLPITQAQASTTGSEFDPGYDIDLPEQPANFYGGPSTSVAVPVVGPLIQGVVAGTDLTAADKGAVLTLVWIIAAFGISILAAFGTYKFTMGKLSSRPGSLLLATIVSGVVYYMFVLWGTGAPGYALIIHVVVGIGTMVYARQYGW